MATLAFAQEQTETPVYELGDSIVVVAGRYKINVKNMAYNYESISAERTLQIASHSALEVVDMTFPTAFVQDKKVFGYGVGTDGGGLLNLRGMGGKPNTGVLFLLNGHPDFMGIFGHPLPDVYGMDDVQQIEILAGPASTVFGDHALGGVVNLVTGSRYEHLISASAEGGTYNSYKAGVSLALQKGKNGLHLTVGHKHSDGHIDKTEFTSTHIQSGWQYQINPGWNLQLLGRYVPYTFDDPARGDNDPAGLGLYGDIRRGNGEVILSHDLKNWNGSFQAYSNLGHHRFYDGFESHDFTHGFSLYEDWRPENKNYSLAFGSDALYFGGKASNPFSAFVNRDLHEINSVGLYAIGFYQPLEKMQIKAGVRYQTHSVAGANLAPMAGLTYHLLPQWRLFTNYQTGFRNPTVTELYLFPSANPDLESELVYGSEAGTQYFWAAGHFIKLSLFRNEADQLIQALPNTPPPPLVKFINTGKNTSQGVEFQARYALTSRQMLQLSYGYLDPGQVTAYNPKHQIKYAWFAHFSKFNTALYGKYIEGLYAGNKETSPLPDYNLLNANVEYKAGNYQIYAKALNILNREYLVLPGYTAPGFQVRLGVRVGW